MRHSVRGDLGDGRWVGIHIPEVRRIDRRGGGGNHFFVHCTIESYRNLQVGIRVASIAAGFQPVIRNNLFDY
jgi:hypothetical protein